MEKRYIVITIDSWNKETKAVGFSTREEAVNAIEKMYVAAVLSADEYDDDETFINDHYAQISNGYRTIEYRLAELDIPTPSLLTNR